MSRVETDPFGTAEPNVKDLISRSIIGPTVHNFGPLRKIKCDSRDNITYPEA
jgi:hypothetical protein